MIRHNNSDTGQIQIRIRNAGFKSSTLFNIVWQSKPEPTPKIGSCSIKKKNPLRVAPDLQYCFSFLNKPNVFFNDVICCWLSSQQSFVIEHLSMLEKCKISKEFIKYHVKYFFYVKNTQFTGHCCMHSFAPNNIEQNLIYCKCFFYYSVQCKALDIILLDILDI